MIELIGGLVAVLLAAFGWVGVERNRHKKTKLELSHKKQEAEGLKLKSKLLKKRSEISEKVNTSSDSDIIGGLRDDFRD
jgi:hypothetical protein